MRTVKEGGEREGRSAEGKGGREEGGGRRMRREEVGEDEHDWCQ